MVRRGVLVTSDSSPKIVVVVHGGSTERAFSVAGIIATDLSLVPTPRL